MNAHRTSAPKSRFGRRVRPMVWQAGILCIFLVTAVAQTKDPHYPRSRWQRQHRYFPAGQHYRQCCELHRRWLRTYRRLRHSYNGALQKIEIGREGSIEARHSDIYFTDTNHNHTGWGNADGKAAIENSKSYHGLMILGRTEKFEGNDRRLVRVWDTLSVGGSENSSFDGQLDVK